MRKATCEVRKRSLKDCISIPAFREEGDATPKRGNLILRISIPAFREEGDVRVRPNDPAFPISIPAFREEGDRPQAGSCRRSGCHFNPRLP